MGSEGLLHQQGGLEVGYRGVESGQVEAVIKAALAKSTWGVTLSAALAGRPGGGLPGRGERAGGGGHQGRLA